MRIALMLSTGVAALALFVDKDVDVLTSARRLALETYKGYTYGSSGEMRIDCVQFVGAVVDDLARQCGVSLTTEDRKLLAIDLSADDAKHLQELVAANDPKTRGVQTALKSAHLGVEVSPGDARPGDFVQYWYRDGEQWLGHSGIIEKVEDGKATIYGSHKSTLQSERSIVPADRKGGIGSGPSFSLTDTARKVYVVRWIRKIP